jgi:nucleolar complex protein 3
MVCGRGLLYCSISLLFQSNINTFFIAAISDLMGVLKELLKESHNLPLEAAIHCILCALKTLRGPGREALPVDPKEYLIPLYNELSRLGVYEYQSVDDTSNEFTDSSGSNMEKSVDAAIQCLDHAFTQRRELSASRLAAFLKRIVTASMHCPPHSSAPLIASARQMALRYASSSKVQHMLENEEDIVGEGMFAPDAEDPEHSNAHATSLWELSLLRFHVNPMVANNAAGMAENKFLKLPGESPGCIGEIMGRNAKEGYILHQATIKRHPLEGSKVVDNDAANERKKKRQRRNQNQVRFITPRKTGQWHLLEPTSISML